MIKVKDFTSAQRAAFMCGWAAAGGYMGDMYSPEPWCAPWLYADEIDAAGDTPEEQGADYWRRCRPEIDAALKEEKECED